MTGTEPHRTARSGTRPALATATALACTAVGSAGARGAQVIGTETNSSLDPDTRPGTLFAADMYMSWLENGAVNVDWSNEHNGIGTVGAVDGSTDCGGQGIFSNASTGSGYLEPDASLPSPPVTFTVPAPANSTCAAHDAVSSAWPGGFGAAVALTRTTAPPTSWTLTWTWPTAGEAVSAGWSRTFTQTGSAVTVTNASYNGAIAANGGTISIGFNGTDTGSDPAPTVFALDGTVCSND
jgi:hypothetical protein